MYQKACLEEAMLPSDADDNHSVALYKERLTRIKAQCEERAADIRQQCHLIFDLKSQVEIRKSCINKTDFFRNRFRKKNNFNKEKESMI